MSNGGIQRIKVGQVKRYFTTFQNEQRYFSNTTYSTFQSSYIKRCSDVYISRLSRKLTVPYENLDKGYRKILDWWEDYNDAIESLEISLSQDNRSYVKEASTNSYVQSKLAKLENYKVTISGEVNANLTTVSSPVFANNKVITNVDVADDVKDNKISDIASSVNQKIDGVEINSSMNESIETGADVSTTSSALSEEASFIDKVNAVFSDVRSKWLDFWGNVKEWINNDIKGEEVSFTVVDENYNQQLEAMTSELEPYEELYNTYIDTYKSTIEELKKYEEDLNVASIMGNEAYYNQLMAEIVVKYGSYEAFETTLSNLEEEMEGFESALKEIQNQKKLLKYGCLSYCSEFEDFVYKDDINYEEIASFDDDNLVMYYYDEETDGNPLEYMKGAIKNLENYGGSIDNIPRHQLAEYDLELINLIDASKIDPSLEKTYNFLYNKYGLKVATQYLDDVQSTVNNLLGQKNAMEFLESLKGMSDEKEILSLVENHLKTSGKGLGKGFETFSEGISSVIGVGVSLFTDYKPSTSYSVGEYESMYIVQALQSGEYGSGLVSNYEISQGIGNMLPSIVLQSSWLMGLSAAGNSYHSSLVEGYSNVEALTYGLISGSSEAVLEKLLGGLPGVGKDIKVSSVKSFLNAIVSEGVEEGIQTITDAHVRQFLFSENIDPSQLSEDVLKSIKYGIITAGILQGGTSVVNTGLSAIDSINNISSGDHTVHKTFAEQINEVNYHTQKGDLLSYTFELNDISEVTPDLLQTINDPSVVQFKVGDETLSYLDIKTKLGLISSTSTITKKTFAEQINEVNYHTQKGDLLSYTFELNDISEVTPELLQAINDPSVVQFKVGDEVYDYIDMKAELGLIAPEWSSKNIVDDLKSNIESLMENINNSKFVSDNVEDTKTVVSEYSESILNNMEVQQLSSFEKLPEKLQQYLSKLLTDENGDFMSVKRLSDIFANAYENGDATTKKIVENFPFLSEILNVSFSDSLYRGGSAFFASDMLFGDKKALIQNEVGFGNDIVFSHEIGHALLQMVDGIKLPENYNSVMENILKNWQANPEQLESFLETARARQEDIWLRVKESTDEWMSANSSDIDQHISEVINDKTKLEEELRNAALRNLVPNSKIEEEVQKVMSNNDLDKISDYIKKSYGTEHMWADFVYESDADSTMKIYRIVLGLIDSAYNGSNPYYSTFYDNGFLRSHDKDYFTKDENSSFNEQFADFVSMKLANIPEAYQITKMLFGEEWINMMESKYSQIANNMEGKVSNYEAGSIDDLFNLDDLMLFNESIFKRIGDFFGKSNARIFQNQIEVSQYFNDSKQYLCAMLRNFAINDSTADKAWVSWYNYLIGAKPVSIINESEIFDLLNKAGALTNEDINRLNQLKQNQLNLTDMEKASIHIFTAWAGPTLSAYNRGAAIVFKNSKNSEGSVFDGTNIDALESYLNNLCIPEYNKTTPFSNIGKMTIDAFNKLIDSVIAKSGGIKEDVIVYRGVDKLFFDGSELSLSDLTHGVIINDPAHISTSILPSTIQNKSKYLLEIEIPKGTPAAYLETFTGVPQYNQQELLLGRNTKFQVISKPKYNRETGQYTVKVKVVSEFSQSNMHTAYNDTFNFNDGLDAYEVFESLRQNNLLTRFRSEVADIYSKGLYDGLDGLNSGEHDYEHVSNVILYSMYMGQQLNLNSHELDMLIDCSKYHDVGIKDLGGGHSNHSLYSANYVKNVLYQKYSSTDLAKIQAIIELHEQNDSNLEVICQKYGIYNTNDIMEVKKIGDILKDADALDRTRFPGNLNPAFLRNKDIATGLIKTSYQIREQKATDKLRLDLKGKKYTDYEKTEITNLINSNQYPMYIINFAANYYRTNFAIGQSQRCNTITDFANYIMINKIFRVR